MGEQNESLQSNEFLGKLTQEIEKSGNLEWETSPYSGPGDLLIRDKQSGKEVLVEFKHSGSYGELPISVLKQVASTANSNKNFAKIFLITFSHLSQFLADKLESMEKVQTIAQPESAELVLGEVQEALR